MGTTDTTYAPPQEAEQLDLEIRTLAGHINAATYRMLCCIRVFDEKRAWEGPGILSMAHWLNWRIGMEIRTARERVRVAHALAQLPLISAAFEKGEVSYSKVRAMTRIARPDTEEQLLEIARCGTASHLDKLAKRFRGTCARQAWERRTSCERLKPFRGYPVGSHPHPAKV